MQLCIIIYFVKFLIYYYYYTVAICSYSYYFQYRHRLIKYNSVSGFAGLMEALYEELRVGDTKNNKSEIKFTTVYPIMVNTGLVKKPRNRFPFLLDMQSPEKVANIIVKSMRRNYKEVSIPWMLMPLDRISRYTLLYRAVRECLYYYKV